MTDESLPVFELEDLRDEGRIRDGTVVGVILAAGASERYGETNKLLVDIEGESMVERAVRPFIANDLESVFVVVGDDADAVSAVLDDQNVEIVRNPNWKAGQSTSLRVGVEAADEVNASAAIFGLGDMPWVNPETIVCLVDAYRYHNAEVIAAAYRGKRGNPVLFSSAMFDSLLAVRGDTGGREVMYDSSNAIAVETRDPGVLRDVDRPADR